MTQCGSAGSSSSRSMGRSSGRSRSASRRPRYSASTDTCCFSAFKVTTVSPLRHCSRKTRSPTGPSVPTVKRSRSPRSRAGLIDTANSASDAVALTHSTYEPDSPRTSPVTEHGDTASRWKRSRGTPAVAATAALMGSACDTATKVSPAMSIGQSVEGGHHARLHLDEGLAVGEPERAREGLDGAPLAPPAQGRELGPGPRAEVALEQAPLDAHPQPEARWRWAWPSPWPARGARRTPPPAASSVRRCAPPPCRPGPCPRRTDAGPAPARGARTPSWACARAGRGARRQGPEFGGRARRAIVRCRPCTSRRSTS